jgi:hypothetical protein
MPKTLPINSTDETIVEFIDQWVALLAEEKHDEALNYLEAEPGWTAELIKEIITDYKESPEGRVTIFNNGTSIDGKGKIYSSVQRKEVEWYSEKRNVEEAIGWFDENRGDIWYDLNINGLVSDLTATFDMEKRGDKIHVILHDIHVM